MSWSAAYRGTEYRLVMAAVYVLCALAVVPSVEHVVTAVLTAVAGLVVVVLVVRRELRIWRRIADTDGTEYGPRPAPVAQTVPAPRDPAAPCLTVVRAVGAGDRARSAGGAA